jgi:hypothetical protein
VVEVSGGKLRISWTAVSRAVTYDLYYRDAGDGNARPANPQITGIAGESIEPGLDIAKAWYVWVQAVNPGGKSPVSLSGLGGLGRPPGALFASFIDLGGWLANLAQNTPLSPYVVAVTGVNLGGYENAMPGSVSSDGLRSVYESFQGRYVSLDLDACTGATIGWGGSPTQSSADRPHKDKLVHVTLPSTSTSRMTPGKIMLGRVTFQDCVNLRTVRLPTNLCYISSGVFQGCVSLEAVDLPASLELIGGSAFAGCSALKTIVCRAAAPPQLSSNAFTGLPNDLVIKVPAGSVAAYKEQWSAYAAKITALED